MVVPRADAGGVTPLKVYSMPPESGEPAHQAAPVLNETDLKQVIIYNTTKLLFQFIT